MTRALGVAIATSVFVGIQAIAGQNPMARLQSPAFRSRVDVIAMNVTVTDPERRYVTDLDRRDFQILEDGRPQQIRFFQKQSLPLALALLIDTSASMEENLAVAQQAAAGFVRELGPADVGSVIDFDTRVQIRQDFTTDRVALETAIHRTAANGATALYTAVVHSPERVEQDDPR